MTKTEVLNSTRRPNGKLQSSILRKLKKTKFGRCNYCATPYKECSRSISGFSMVFVYCSGCSHHPKPRKTGEFKWY
jgi:RNase P subunit RPR2